ncbi:MAG: proton-conducting transporter membrane subunit [Halomonas sp.]|nr:proton-conducting transporter membrane subunit [Halomonas sp.]
MALIVIGFLVKAGAVGVHIWLPSSYGEAEGETSALLSAVLSKVPVFGIILAVLALVGSGVEAASGARGRYRGRRGGRDLPRARLGRPRRPSSAPCSRSSRRTPSICSPTRV